MEELRQNILQMTSDNVKTLYSMWAEMFEPMECTALLEKLHNHASGFYADLIAESIEKRGVLESELNDLQNEAAELNRLLNTDNNINEKPADVPLIIWHNKLDKSIEHLREELRLRRAEICELLLQQEQLCEDLGKPPLPLIADPLPSAKELNAFRDHLKSLREVQIQRTDELYKIRQQIKQDMKVLELLPQTDEEKRLLNQPNHNLTPDTFNALRKMQACCAAQVKELQQGIDNMRRQIHELWNRLPESNEFAMLSVNEAVEYNQRTYDVLRAELQRCQVLRRQNLKTFIEKLRIEIKQWWDLTLKSEKERKRFSNYYNDLYNEDLLELHELELEDLKSFYNKNKEIFELYARRSELWSRMEALEAKTNEPDRFNNRGGKLLKEERERKAISNKLPKIEQQITDLVHAYMEREHTQFLIDGENILDRISGDWIRCRQAKDQQISARKHQGAVTATPGTAGKMLPPSSTSTARVLLTPKNMSTRSASTMSLRKTPSQTHLANTMNAACAKSTGNLHKRKMTAGTDSKVNTPVQAKRSLMATLSSLKSASSTPTLRKPVYQKNAKKPIKKVLALDNTLRRSSGLKRRSVGGSANKSSASKKVNAKRFQIPKLRMQLPTSDECESANDENKEADETYGSFIKCIEPAARSSVLPLRSRNVANSNFTRPRAVPNKNKQLTNKKALNESEELTDDEKYRLATLPNPRRFAAASSSSTIGLPPGVTNH